MPGPGGRRFTVERVAAVVGLVSAAVGLLVTFLGLPDTIASAFGGASSKTAELELEQKRVALAEASASLDVRYIVMRYELVLGDEQGKQPGDRGDDASTIRSYHLMPNEVLDELQSEEGARKAPCWGGDEGELGVTLLAVSNRGKRDAASVKVAVERLHLARVVTVNERDRDEDYVAKLRQVADRRTTDLIEIPEILGPGKGVLIPLWLNGARRDRPGRWCVVSRNAIEPTSTSFSDPVLAETKRVDVRRMLAPVILGRGFEGRG